MQNIKAYLLRPLQILFCSGAPRLGHPAAYCHQLALSPSGLLAVTA